MSAREDLIARVREATGPDREIDFAIVRYFCKDATVGTYITDDEGDIVFHAPELGIPNKARCPAYTASIDAALALVERVRPTLVINATKLGDGSGLWQVNEAWDSESDAELVSDMQPVDPRPLQLTVLELLLLSLESPK